MSGLFTNLYGQDSPSEQVADIAVRTAQTSAALTDNSTGSAGATIAAGVGCNTLAFFVNLAELANGDVLTNYTPGYKFKILAVDFQVEKAVTTGSKAATLNLEIDTTNVTGGAVALTSANCTPKGVQVAGSAVTAANTGTAAQTLSIEVSSVTTFVEGTGWILVKIQNMDTADAIASLAAQANAHTVEIAADIAKDNLIRANFRAKGWMA